jgi:hypothetical protein
MKALKILSIVGFVAYPILLIFAVAVRKDGNILPNLISLSIYILFFTIHAVVTFMQAVKYRKPILKISSITAFAVSLLIIITNVVFYIHLRSGGWTSESEFVFNVTFMILFVSVVFAIALSIITLVQSSKVLRKGKE